MASQQYRVNERQPISALCRIRPSASFPRTTIVRNLTPEGCALDCVPSQLERRDVVQLFFGNVGPVDARIVWIAKGIAAGLRFEDPLHPAIFDRLVTLAKANMERRKEPLEMIEDIPVRRPAVKVMAC